jgi:ATP-dependent helicase STH1/SNF2
VNFGPSSTSKERLKVLKADDEEAYMKLIDTAKDTL